MDSYAIVWWHVTCDICPLPRHWQKVIVCKIRLAKVVAQSFNKQSFCSQRLELLSFNNNQQLEIQVSNHFLTLQACKSYRWALNFTYEAITRYYICRQFSMKLIIHHCLGNDFFKTFITLYRYDLFWSSYTTHRSKNRNGLQNKYNLLVMQAVKNFLLKRLQKPWIYYTTHLLCSCYRC